MDKMITRINGIASWNPAHLHFIDNDFIYMSREYYIPNDNGTISILKTVTNHTDIKLLNNERFMFLMKIFNPPRIALFTNHPSCFICKKQNIIYHHNLCDYWDGLDLNNGRRLALCECCIDEATHIKIGYHLYYNSKSKYIPYAYIKDDEVIYFYHHIQPIVYKLKKLTYCVYCKIDTSNGLCYKCQQAISKIMLFLRRRCMFLKLLPLVDDLRLVIYKLIVNLH